jgi:hypothetical protein
MIKYLRKQLKGRKIYFGSQLQRFQPMADWLHCFRSEMKQNITVVEACGTGICSPHGDKEREKRRKEREREGKWKREGVEGREMEREREREKMRL